MKKLSTTLCTLVLFSATAFAGAPCDHASAKSEGDHSLGSIQGTHIDLKTYDHAFAGAIGNFVAWGFLDEATSVAELTIRKYEKTIKAEFRAQDDGRIGGVIAHKDASGSKETHVYFDGIDAAKKMFYLKINGERASISIEADDYQNGHFVNPRYTATLAGETLSYRMEGEACYGLSANFAMLILGAYAH